MGKIAEMINATQNDTKKLRHALEIIIKLYTDKSHFIYELLQNAEDAEAKSIRFIQYPDRLEVLHDGRPFTSSNLIALCDVGRSDKVDDLNKIGKFGVGFKSVFGICDTVRLYSNPERFRKPLESDAVPFSAEMVDFGRLKDIPEEPIPEPYTTRFVFPYTVGQTFSGFTTTKELNVKLSHKLRDLGITTLLFMKNLELIEYRIELGGEPITGEYMLEKEAVNDHCTRVSALGSAGKKSGEDSVESISYLKFSRPVEKYAQRTVDIAFPIRIDKDGSYQCVRASSPYVSVYFPTDMESKLDFIVQGPYRTTPNRSSIPADDEDNIFLAEETAILLRQSLLELRDMGKLNMSFLKALPIAKERFENFDLFLPLYEETVDLFRSVAIIPSKSGRYVFAKYAKIARRGQLPTVFTDELLTQLINDGHSYYWLPTFLTETSSEYRQVFTYLARTIKVQVIAPEDLRTYFSANPRFLPAMTDDWLVQLYGLLENIQAAFSRDRFATNMTTAEIVKTSTGKFVAPFRKENWTYIPNVFLPSPNIKSEDIHFVDQTLYARCRHFFDDILHLQKVNEYEYFIKDIEKRYKHTHIDDEQHIDDIKMLLKYLREEDCWEEVERIIRERFLLRCTDGGMRNAYSNHVYLPVTSEGINIKEYYRNIRQNVSFVDLDFYRRHGIDEEKLKKLEVRSSLLVDENIVSGVYSSGAPGRPPEWHTSGDFRWKLSIDALRDALKYISAHPAAKDSILKSQTIMKILAANETHLCGHVHIGRGVEDKENEPCEMLHILRGDSIRGWDRKWLFTESLELVSPREISRRDISRSIYGSFKPDTVIFKLLGFKRTEDDEIDELKKAVPQDKLDAYFERELRLRYGISTADLDERYGGAARYDGPVIPVRLQFPEAHVRNWDALKKHAAEMLIYADPVEYANRVRSVRVSDRPKEIRAYLRNMYRYDGADHFKFACQLCHDSCSNFEYAEIFPNPKTELDPVNLCLCPNCAARYRRLRSDDGLMSRVRKAFLERSEEDIDAEDYVSIAVNQEDELWFTQTHFAEIRELMRLEEEVKNSPMGEQGNVSSTAPQAVADGENERSGLSAYSGYIGKIIRRKKDGFVGVVKDVTKSGNDIILCVNIVGGEEAGKEKRYKLSIILNNRGIYSISDGEAITQG